MFKVGDFVQIVSTPTELGGHGHSWYWYDIGRYRYLGRKCRIIIVYDNNTYKLCFKDGFTWEDHQLRKVK